MAKRNELASLLGGLNPGNARGREHIAFGDLISRDQIERFPLEPNPSGCNGSSLAQRLRRNINHSRASITADVSKSLHFLLLLVILSLAENLRTVFAPTPG